MIDHEKLKTAFNNDTLIAKLEPDSLVKLAKLAINAEQLDKIGNAKNINHKVVTAIIENSTVPLISLNLKTLINLITLTKKPEELYKLMIEVIIPYGERS